MSDTSARTTVGLVTVAASYVSLVALVPPHWAPWSSSLGLFGLLFAYAGAVLAAICGGALVAFEFATDQSSHGRALGVAITRPVAAIVPLYGYSVHGGFGPLAPVNLAAFAIAVLAGLATRWFALPYDET